MKVKNVIEQIERIFGRQPEQYIIQLIEDAMMDIAANRRYLKEDVKMDLIEDKRWYSLDDDIMEITRVEIKDTNDRYVVVPKLADAHKLLKEDEY